MQVDVPGLEVTGSDERGADKAIDLVAKALDKFGDFCGRALESHNFVREELGAQLNDRFKNTGKKWQADELGLKYTGFHGARVMWPADLLQEEININELNSSNRKERRRKMKKDKKKQKKEGKYTYR